MTKNVNQEYISQNDIDVKISNFFNFVGNEEKGKNN